MSPSRRACAALAFILAFSSSLLAAPIRVTGQAPHPRAATWSRPYNTSLLP